MLILINGSGFHLSSELREQVQEKLEASLARFSKRLAKLSVFMADVNGPKKGLDKSLRLVIDIKSRPVIVIEEKGQAWMNILGTAADRATRTITKKVNRFRSRGDRTSSGGVEAASIRKEEAR